MKYDLSKLITWDFCDEMVETIIASFGSLKDICFMLCGLFALIYFANMLMKTWAKGEPFDAHSLFKPFVIGVVIMNFWAVHGLIDSLAGPLTGFTEAIAENERKSLDTKLAEYERKVKEYDDEKQRITAERDYDAFDKVEMFFDNFGYYVTETLMDCIEIILSVIYSALKISVRVFNISFRVILIVLGPISFAISVIPYFKDNWKSWIAKYINVCMYLVVASALDVIIVKFRSMMLDMQISKYGDAISQIRATGDFFGLDAPFEASVITCVFMLIFVSMYLVIPSIVNMIIEKGETAGVQAGLGASMIGSGKIGAAMVMRGHSLGSSAAKTAAGAARLAGSGIMSHLRSEGGEGDKNDNGAITN